MKRTLLQHIASTWLAMKNCEESGNEHWRLRHAARLDHIAEKHLPSGAGIDCGTKIRSLRDETLALAVPYHCMNEQGYIGWLNCEVLVTASLAFGFTIEVVAPEEEISELEEYDDFDTERVFDYLAETFDYMLRVEHESIGLIEPLLIRETLEGLTTCKVRWNNPDGGACPAVFTAEDLNLAACAYRRLGARIVFNDGRTIECPVHELSVVRDEEGA
jgi:hypothetical protein